MYPALHKLVSKWAPPDEKGKFVWVQSRLTLRNSIISIFPRTDKCIGRGSDWNSSNMVNSWLSGRVSGLGLCILYSSNNNILFHNHLVYHCVRRSRNTSTNNDERERVHWEFVVRDNSCKGKSMSPIFHLGKYHFVSQLIKCVYSAGRHCYICLNLYRFGHFSFYTMATFGGCTFLWRRHQNIWTRWVNRSKEQNFIPCFYNWKCCTKQFVCQVLGFNIGKSGVLASLPYLARFFAGIIFGSIGDLIRRKHWFQVTTIRKSFCVFCMENLYN